MEFSKKIDELLGNFEMTDSTFAQFGVTIAVVQ